MKPVRFGPAWMVLAALCGGALEGCAGTAPMEATGSSYRIGASLHGRDADDAGWALVRQLNTPSSTAMRRVVHTVMPEMPAAAIMADTTGTVDVWLRIDRRGAVADATVEGSPPPILGQAVLAAVRQWRFEAGESTVCCLLQRFEFKTLSTARGDAVHPDGPSTASH